MTAEWNARRTCFADSPCMMRGWKLLLHLILGHKPSYSLFSFRNLSRISQNSISRRSTTNENSGWRQSLGSIPRKSFPFSPSAEICLSDERTAKDAFLCTPFIENWNFLSVTWERWWAVRKPKARNFGEKKQWLSQKISGHKEKRSSRRLMSFDFELFPPPRAPPRSFQTQIMKNSRESGLFLCHLELFTKSNFVGFRRENTEFRLAAS